MNQLLACLRNAAVAALLIVGASTKADAQLSVWNFTGNCIDCAEQREADQYPVTGTLTLAGYVMGELATTQFVSFTYNGSNLIGPYTVLANPSVSMRGDLTAPVQSFALSFGEFGYFNLGLFQLLILSDAVAQPVEVETGLWETCPDLSSCGSNEPADYGTRGRFVRNISTTVPEPGTYALMVVGLAVMGIAARRKQRQA